jgi:VanZ family protein
MRPWLWKLAFWAAVAATLVMALLPKPPQLPLDPSDKIQHVVAFAALTLLGIAAYRRAPQLQIALGLGALGAAIELLQTIPTLHRHGELMDWVVDLATIAAATAFAKVAGMLANHRPS